ncbi:class I SAM-dependent methyltransferase [Actinocatenispora comari]|uniref:Methyltransferase type 12 n=1 Tax=Actinocatenispora comari TaxID=2807577 RepID=A0A8J4AIS1_9ACTN|nr:class I SAM-dependent methyltransferase [Actinocatenispora comari]GIL31979.1 methyltransferase type 12 [Actinocatenispora comari]
MTDDTRGYTPPTNDTQPGHAPATNDGQHAPVADDGQRGYARKLAAEAVAVGDDTGWFERLYAAAESGTAVVPWADREPNPLLVDWSRTRTGHQGRALVVGCGLGDDAEHLAALGYDTVAFDVAPSAVRAARERFAGSPVDYRVADLLDPPADLLGTFDLVFEAYTVQTLQGAARRRAIARFAELLRPGGRLLVIARARDDDDPAGRMPWPLTRTEIDAFAVDGLRPVLVEDLADTSEDPPVRRWRAEFVRR